jgi:hypothetical protein
MPEMPQPTMSYGQTKKRNAGLYINAGVLCAIIGVFVFPEILCSAGIILGSYAWRLDCNEQRNRGLAVIIVGIVAMLVGLYYFAYITVYDFLP